MRNQYSKWALILISILILAVHFFYYPKWQKTKTEATISWDVSGYYMYLPATFIYKDLKKCTFHQEVLKKYSPTFDFQQAFIHEESGNYVMKYSIGQAISFAPAFFLAHGYASISDSYPADGFSKPYQVAISMWSILICLLGLFVLRKILLLYFNDIPVAWTLIFIVLGSNYLNYSAIDGAQTHNFLFTYYTLLILASHRFYIKPSMRYALLIGFIIGISALTRPTELLAVIIPLLWGVKVWDLNSLGNRLHLIKKEWSKYLAAILLTASIGMIQLIYWNYVSGEWIVYSYEDQGFSWLSPHIKDCLISYKAGWLTYSPLMIFSLIGFAPLFKQRNKEWSAIFIFSMIFMYVAFAWDIWWYGGSLGQRTMVQAYPILAFSTCAYLDYFSKRKKWTKVIIATIMGIFIYFNLWFTHQAHLGGILRPGEMTRGYFKKTLGTYTINPDDIKLLDNNDDYSKEIKSPVTLINEDYEASPINSCSLQMADGSRSNCVNKEAEFTAPLIAPLDGSYKWVRAYADFKIGEKNYNLWNSPQFVCEFYQGDYKLKNNIIRPFRLLQKNQTRRLYLDAKVPKKADKVRIFLWNCNSDFELLIDNIEVIGFNDI